MSAVIAWLIVVGCALLLISYCYAQMVAARARSFETHANTFFDRIQPFIKDHETPSSLLALLAILNANLRNKKAARHFLLHSLSSGGPRKSHQAREIMEFLNRRTELQKPFLDALSGGLKAISYRSWFFGLLLRRLFLTDVNRNPQRAAEVGVTVSNTERLCEVH